MKLPILIAALVLAGCASKPAPPSWQPEASSALDAFTESWLKGATAAANADFARARRETGSTGRPELVAKVELVRCAVRAAALEFDDCPGFAALAQDATAAEHAYAAYLAGRWDALPVQLLPEQHRPVVASGSLAGLDDPLSRLVAAGALFKAGRIGPRDIESAVETASRQGWRRPLLAWLSVQEKRAQAAGDVQAAEKIRRRMALVEGRVGS